MKRYTIPGVSYQREYEDYEFLRQKMENLEGGVLTLPNPLSGKEYQRILTALEYEGDNYFYGFVDIPTTEGWSLCFPQR